ncbi:MAG: hypothetical protein PHZ00_05285 [Candidatus Peribacteraceae bacterium]|nr:hypothetical protein [Candidatus Peribacteraceae bacterium]
MTYSRTRNGSTLIEMALFLGIVAIMSSSLVGAFIALQEARIRQQYMSEVGQRGALLLGAITKAVRSAEVIVSPVPGNPTDTLVLQMPQNDLNPTVFMPMNGGNLLLIERTGTAALLGTRVTVSDLRFQNVENTSITMSFDLHVLLPTMPQRMYTEHFAGTSTLTPKMQNNGGCPSCPVPTCTGGRYEWHYCDNGACTVTPKQVGC